MSMMHSVFLEPLDVLILRGNKLFGDAGSFGEALMPPWPSVAAGALRSRMLVNAGVDFTEFAQGKLEHPSLGTPSDPKDFVLCEFGLARRRADGSIERLYPIPADLTIHEGKDKPPSAQRLEPTALPKGLAHSAPLPKLPVLAETTRSKPASGYWLNETGWSHYLAGKTPDPSTLVKTGDLWSLDLRVGVGLNPDKRSVEDGKLFALQAVACKPGVGFIASVRGATPPTEGLVRLGGDGRGAALAPAPLSAPGADLAAIAQAGRCRLVLTTPGLFSEGWLPHGVRLHERREDGALRFALHGVEGWLTAAAVPRAEVISGWDLAQWQPKAARRAAPTGSVYWLEDLKACPGALDKLVREGLWSNPCEDVLRRAEGFNRLTLACF